MSTGDAPDRSDDRDATCRPCRGTGRVISRLGGEESSVTCPWCEGTGRFRPDHDAQAEPAEREAD